MQKLLSVLLHEEEKLHYQSIKNITILSGNIVACDPNFFEESTPFQKNVQPGSYPVSLLLDKENSVAGVLITFSNQKPVRFEMATKPGQHIKNLEKNMIFGHPVDTGLSCFADGSAVLKMEELERKKINELGDDFISFYDDVLEEKLEENNDMWGNLILDEEHNLNALIFSSGYGDGFYASYWGIDEKGNVVSLVTDFNIL
ncbi:DUF4241 domain-containing protein [Priestia endophytica]|uniref:DUF4241 domain-containing protein n=1 Tax=Priestia endophytica TaxID=135735 RepID=UPI000DCA387C|nr:DUF4241 domain-containing protein [Priestia endophytica]RAS80112.1 cytoplasmic protein [Priestia endophytica]